jgi:hypothetical protein
MKTSDLTEAWGRLRALNSFENGNAQKMIDVGITIEAINPNTNEVSDNILDNVAPRYVLSVREHSSGRLLQASGNSFDEALVRLSGQLG